MARRFQAYDGIPLGNIAAYNWDTIDIQIECRSCGFSREFSVREIIDHCGGQTSVHDIEPRLKCTASGCGAKNAKIHFGAFFDE